jgi:hypothetical protein
MSFRVAPVLRRIVFVGFVLGAGMWLYVLQKKPSYRREAGSIAGALSSRPAAPAHHKYFGRVLTSADRRPVPNAAVTLLRQAKTMYVHDPIADPPLFETRTDESGLFCIEDRSRHATFAIVSARGFAPATFVPDEDHTTEDRADDLCLCDGATLAIHVRDENGGPLSNYRVCVRVEPMELAAREPGPTAIFILADEITYSRTTDLEGVATFEDMPAGAALGIEAADVADGKQLIRRKLSLKSGFNEEILTRVSPTPAAGRADK